MPRPIKISSWLRRPPEAIRVRVKNEDGDRIIAVPKGERRWAQVTKTIEALKPYSMEALDAKGVTLRVHAFETDEEEEEREEEREQEVKNLTARQQELAQLGRIISEAGDNSAKRHAEAYKQAFDMLAGLVKSVTDSQRELVTMVNGLLRKLSEAVQTAPAGEDNGDGVLSTLIEGVMARNGMGKPAAPTNGASNGAARIDETLIEKGVEAFLRKRAAEAAEPEGD